MKKVDFAILEKYFIKEELGKIKIENSSQKFRLYGIPGKKIAIVTPSGQKDAWIMIAMREFFKGREQKIKGKNKVYLILG